MKIAQLMLSRGFGGAERYFVDLSLALAARGHAVHVLCHPEFVQRTVFARQPTIRLTPITAHGSWDPWARRRILQACAADPPDHVQAHLARGAHLAGWATRRLGLPLVVKTHNDVNLKYYRAVDRYIATTPEQQDYLLRHGVAAARIRLIPNFSCLRAVPRAAHQQGAAPRWLALGRWVPCKGFDVLLQAFARACRAGLPGELWLGGAGPEQAYLRRLAATLGIAARVTWIGWVDDVAALLAAADAFILPSRAESFGIVLLEAMAAGLPIIATRTPGPSTLLDDDTAYLVPPDDAAALAAALTALWHDPAAANARAARARARFDNRYAETVVVPTITALYEELVEAGTTATAARQPTI